MDSNYLKLWVNEQNVWQRTIDGFWHCFENYKKEETEEYEQYFHDFHSDLLTLCKSQVALKIKDWNSIDNEYNENLEFVEAVLDLFYKDENIGYYSLLFNFSGETFDDYFVLE